MRTFIGALAALILAIGAAGPAQAQTGERVLDALTDLLRGTQQVQGYVVAVRDADVVVRGRDNRTYAVSTAGIDRQQVSGLQPGQPVKMTLKRGTAGDTLAASSLEVDNGAPHSFRTVAGVVESASGSRLQFRTAEGFVIPIDLNQIVGPKPSLKSGEQATLTYEQTGQDPLTAVWIEPRTSFGAASPPTSFGAASPRTSEPPGVTGGGYERIHGFVESIGLGTLTLKTDDGRTMMVDVRNSRGPVGDVKPGDLINVVGRSGGGERFVAETVRKD